MSRARVLLAAEGVTGNQVTPQWLEQGDYDVLTKDTFDDAGRALASAEVDVLIVDTDTLCEQQIRFARQVSALHPDQQMILMTGCPSVASAVEAVRLPVIAYLVKPVDLTELRQQIAIGVEQSRLLRTMQQCRRRLSDWTQELDITARTARISAQRAGSAEDAFLKLSMSNVIGVMKDMQEVLEVHNGAQRETVAREKLGCPPPLTAVNALRDAVATLVRTKDAFRSRELGELRRRLESLLPSGDVSVESVSKAS